MIIDFNASEIIRFSAIRDAIPIDLRLIREIQRCEFGVVLFCSLVIRLCGVDFIFEISDDYVLSFIAYNCSPFLCSFLPTDSYIF